MSTERLRFGMWKTADTLLAEAIWGDPEVANLTGGPFTVAEVIQRLDLEVENWRLYQIQYWPVFRMHGGALAGCCGLRPRDSAAGIAELGFQFCRDAWGQGFATEAANAVIDRARSQGFAALIAGHHPENQASKRTLLRLGFSYTHDELYPPTGMVEPCYKLKIDSGDQQIG